MAAQYAQVANKGRRKEYIYTVAEVTSAARTICIAVALEGFAFYGALAYLGAYLRDEFAMRFTLIGLALAGFGIGGIA